MRRGYAELCIDVLMEFSQAHGNLSQTRIVQKLNLSWYNMKKILIHLKRNGLIIEVDHNGRGRQQSAYELTPKGWNAVAAIKNLSEVIPFSLESNEKDSRIARLP